LQPLQYRAKEELDTEAYGATVGLDLKVRILRRLSFVLGATVSPLWADTDMQLLYTGDYIDWPVGIDVIKRVTTGLKRSKDQFTYRAGAHAGLTYDVNRWFSIGVNGGVDYWNDVPTVKYPIYDPAEHVSPYDPGTSMRIPSIGHQSMFNWTGGVNFIFRFGGP